MAPAADGLRCNHLRSPATPNVFASEWAQLMHINEQISSLDNHISQLKALRDALHLRSCRLHNALSPINTLPIEVLSYIFQQVVDPRGLDDPVFDRHRAGFGRSFILSSVSALFRHVALGTPGLWQRIPLKIRNVGAIGKASSLLHHCIALAPNVNVSVSGANFNEEETTLVIDTLLTAETMRKVKAFQLYQWLHLRLWIPKFNGSLFPMIDSLSIEYRARAPEEDVVLDFGSLNTMTRLTIYSCLFTSPILAPPSMQSLTIANTQGKCLLSLLSKFPNLVECYADIIALGSPPFPEPLVHDHLKRLHTFSTFVMGNLTKQRLQLPSLELLHAKRNLTGIALLCRNIAATLTTLVLTIYSSHALNHADLIELCQLPLPKLKNLKCNSFLVGPLLLILIAFSRLNSERGAPSPRHFPALEFVTLESTTVNEDLGQLPDILENYWWTCDSLHLNLKFLGFSKLAKDWPMALGLRDEINSVVDGRQIDITWGD